MRVCSIGSGSKGNCIYLECEGEGIVIDNGLSCKDLKNRMQDIGLDINNIKHILVTHDHSDHIKGVGTLSRLTNAKVYAQQDCYNAFKGKVGDINYCGDNSNYENGFYIANIKIKPFRTPHDATYSVGYRIEGEGKVFALATDLGVVNDAIFRHLQGADFAVVECNHDIQMLKNGSYPDLLKKRILGNRGHLANVEGANVVAKLCNLGTKQFMLAHLSEDNNLPELALKENISALKKIGATQQDVSLEVLNQYKPSKIYEV